MSRLRACANCGRIHRGDCPNKTDRLKKSTDVTKLRTCRRWDETRKLIYTRDHYLCRVCWEQGRISADRVEAHHIVPLSEEPELAYDIDNGITLCVKHHKAADRGEIDRDSLRQLAHSEISIPPVCG